MKNKKKFSLFVVLIICSVMSYGQTGVGIGLYPTGTETGLGFRLNKDKKISLDARIARANFYNKPQTSSFVTEVSGIYRIVLLEKVHFHIGIGFRTDWNSLSGTKIGGVMPIGVEAFPFSFQNAGLFFEVAPFYVAEGSVWHAGMRTAAGFVFYFPHKTAEKP